MNKPLFIIRLCSACVVLIASSLTPAQSADHRQRVRQILDATNVQGGLVVHVGCGDGKLAAALARAGSYLVHGLDNEVENVEKARRYAGSLGLEGRVSFEGWEGRDLPYIDNLVNLIVLDQPAGVPMKEVMRVLCPNGAAYVKQQGQWRMTRKPRPQEIDEWTHYLYDASNNAVAHDTVVGPPEGLQWTCAPEFARSHEHFGSVSAMVSSGGRVFYIVDEGPISSVFLEPRWKLVARNAFSGVLLWEHPISNWESQLRGFRSGPPEIGRRLVAGDDCVYAALGYGEPVVVLDAADGQRRNVLAGTEGAREILRHDGLLYVLADDMTKADHDKRKEWIHEVAPTLTGYRFPQKPLAMYGKQRIIALEAAGGKPLWTKHFDAAGEILPATLAVAAGRVCLQTVSHVVCLEAESGDELWRAERPVAKSRFSWSTPTLVISDGVVLTVDRLAAAEADETPPEHGSRWLMDSTHQSKRQDAEIVAFSLESGQSLWRAPCFENYDTQLDIFVIDGTVWVGDLRHKRDPGFTEGRDVHTGRVTATIPNNLEFYNLNMGHHRCYRNKATVRYLLLGRDGIEFVDVKNGTGCGNWWVRGTCQYGIMPANGLIYVPQHSCACHPAEKLTGFNVLAPRSACSEKQSTCGERLVRGPAYSGKTNDEPVISTGDWPTYRRDAARSGFQNLPAPQRVIAEWTQQFEPPVTAPVVAAGRVFFAQTDHHTLYAISAEDGSRIWDFVAEGRIDSPPTIHGGACVFGTRNGVVYCLNASDGALRWRFRAGPQHRLLFADEQLESIWPVHGSVLVDDATSAGSPLVYFAAGRSSHVDGGIFIYALELQTGKVRHRTNVTMSEQAEAGRGIIKERVLPDILSAQRGDVFMRNMRLSKTLAPLDGKAPHLYAPAGFLDDTWWHRTYWMYGTQIMSGYGGWPRVGNVVPAGRLLVLDGKEIIYGYGRMSYRAGAGHVSPDAAKDYKLFAEVLEPKPKDQSNAKNKKRKPAGRRQIVWSKNLPFLAKSIVLTRDALLVAGGQSLTDGPEQHRPGEFCAVSRSNGTWLSGCNLPAPPILDGMAFTKAGVFVCAIDGSVTLLKSDK